jgi:alcohol dehydrogenase
VQTASFNALNPMGRLVVFGAAEFTPGKNRPNYLKAALQYLRRPKSDVMDMISDNRSVMAFNLIWLWDQVELMKELLADMMKVEITPPHVGHEFSFEDAHAAIDCLRSGKTIGKVVLLIKN